MCLGVPMRVAQIDGFVARCEARGISRTVSLFLLQHEEVVVGDLVLVHVGNAIQKMNEAEAEEAWQLFDEILEIESNAMGDGGNSKALFEPAKGEGHA